MKYTDVVLVATEPRIIKTDGQKRLIFNLLVPGVFNDPIPRELDAIELRELTNKAGGADADWKDAQRIGEALAAALLPDVVWNVLNSKITQAEASQEGVRVRLMLSGSELNRWPWEFLVFNRAGGEIKVSDFLALVPNVSLVRHTATPLPAWRVKATPPARVLVGVASPDGWPKLQVAKESDGIAKAFKGSAQLIVETVGHLQKSNLPSKSKPAHLFHFAGHGKFELTQSSVPGSYEGKASVVLEDGYGDEDMLDAELLAVVLRDAGVRVAVLGACQTAQRDDLGMWSSVAESLLKAGLAAVVGMQFSVLDKSALCFAERFYGALAVGLSIDEAVAAGRVAVAVAGDSRGWATPILYLRSPDGVIFNEFASSPALETARVNARQEIDVLKGRAINVRIDAMEAGIIEAVQKAKVVEKGALLENVAVKTMTSGKVDAIQQIDKVKGKSTNVSIDTLTVGGGSVCAAVDVGEVSSGGSLTGVKIGTLGSDRSTPPSRSTKAKPPLGPVKAPLTRGAASGWEQPKATRAISSFSNVEVGKVTGGQVIGTQLNRREGDRIRGNQVNVASGGQASNNTGVSGPVKISGPVTIIQGSTEGKPSSSAAPQMDEPSIEEKIRLDVALPESAVVNEPFDVVIAVKQPDAPTLAVADLDQVVSGDGSIFRSEEDDVVKYRVEVTGAGFEVTPKNYVIELRPMTNSRPVAFQLTSTRTGKRSLIVNAYQENEALAAQTRVTIEVEVAVSTG
ncbi:MAG: CHAT domain-containing protein [Nitrospira sp.]|nr:CHAT domain-containing protein [Nitrospira sp.]